MTGAAFFDLDRTLLRKASGPVFSAAMRETGVVPRKLPGESLLYWWTDSFGETLGSMALARQAVLVALGKREGAFDEAAELAAERLVDQVGPFAHILIDEHHAAGRPVVMATTTPYHLVRPLAERLGFDDVIATRYAVGDDGRYTGRNDGPFVWSQGKLSSVRRWAREHDVDLADSFAYSDSVFDLPLLAAVGHPGAVNPDPRLFAVAAAKRWPILSFDRPPGSLTLPVVDVSLQRVATFLAFPEVFPYARFDIDGLDNLPEDGPVIFVGNHRSYFDLPTMMVVMRRTSRHGSFLAKKELFDVPLLGPTLRLLGGVSVDREHVDPTSPDPLEEAEVALAGGALVAVMPQGTIPRGLDFFSERLVGRPSAARLAAKTRAPVIPFAISGTEKVWPRGDTMPTVTNLFDPPTVRVRIGGPVDLKYRSERADTNRIMAAISAMLPPQETDLAQVTLEDVAGTYPGGRIPAEDRPEIEAALRAARGE